MKGRVSGLEVGEAPGSSVVRWPVVWPRGSSYSGATGFGPRGSNGADYRMVQVCESGGMNQQACVMPGLARCVVRGVMSEELHKLMSKNSRCCNESLGRVLGRTGRQAARAHSPRQEQAPVGAAIRLLTSWRMQRRHRVQSSSVLHPVKVWDSSERCCYFSTQIASRPAIKDIKEVSLMLRHQIHLLPR